MTPRYSPAELAAALGLHAPTDEQAAVIAAPPGPLVVIAGAGAGKTETMAARVVWLVANGYADPGQVLGSDVHPQGRRPAAAPGPVPAGPAGRRRPVAGATDAVTADPAVVSTYHAFAGALLREHGLLLPVEPDTRLLSETELWQLAFDVVSGYPGELDTDKTPAAVTADGAAAVGAARRAPGEHRPAARHPPRTGAAGAHAARRVPTSATAGPASGCCGCWPRRPSAPNWCPLIDALHDRLRAEKAMDFGMQMAAAARLAVQSPAGRRAAAATLPGGAARRIPGHRPRAARRAVGAVRRRRRRRAGADRGRRPDPVDLRLARRVGDQPAAVHHRLPARRRHPGAAPWSCAPAGAIRRAPCGWPTRCRRRRGGARWRSANCGPGPVRSRAPCGARCCPTWPPSGTGSPTTWPRATAAARR